MLVLRTCKADMTSYNGFKWPESGPVSCPDWRDDYQCGHGLHGLPWGEGDGSLLDWSLDAKWLVVEVQADLIKYGQGDLIGKCKFPRGIVVVCGTRTEATEYLAQNGGHGKAIVGYQATAGDRGTATAGDGGTIQIRYWDNNCNRPRIKTGYVGEEKLKPNVRYRLNDRCAFVEVSTGTVLMLEAEAEKGR